MKPEQDIQADVHIHVLHLKQKCPKEFDMSTAKKFFLVASIPLICALIILLNNNRTADAHSPITVAQPVEPILQITANPLEQPIENPSVVSEVVEEISSSGKDGIVQKLMKFKEIFDEKALRPGWVMMQYTQYDAAASGPRPLPSPHQRIFWSKLDDEGMVVEEVEYAYAPEIGQVLLGYTTNGVNVSMWHDETYAADPYRPNYDFYISSIADYMNKTNRRFDLSIEPVKIQDRNADKVELKNEFTDAEKEDASKRTGKAVEGELHRFWYDIETGQVLQMEYWYVMEDQTLILDARTEEIEFLFDQDPPTEVLDILNQGVTK